MSRRQLAIMAQIPPSSLQSAMSRGKNMTVEMLQSIAGIFDVSSDYLLGITDVRNYKTDIRATCEYTGLSEKAAKYFHWETQDPRTKAAINTFLESADWEDLHAFAKSIYWVLDHKMKFGKQRMIFSLKQSLPDSISEKELDALYTAIENWGGQILGPKEAEADKRTRCESIFSYLLSKAGDVKETPEQEGGHSNALNQEEND